MKNSESARLDGLLASLALGSRAQCARMVREGRVTVDGKTATDAGMRVAKEATLSLDGAALDARTERHVMLNKPAGVLTAARDGKQPTVQALLPEVYTALGCMPVGRLDKDTEGLLLFTTDGQLAHRLLSPKRHVWKEYEATLDGEVGAGDIAAFAQGLTLSDFTALPAALSPLPGARARVRVREGKFHQVKRMFEARGKRVLALKRLSFGSLLLDEALAPGQFRELTDDEIVSLYQTCSAKDDVGG